MRAASLWVLGLAFLAATGARAAQDTQDQPQPNPSAPVWAENLYAPVPQGWMIANESGGGGITLDEFVPKGQTNEVWTDKVTVIVQRDPNAIAAPVSALFKFNQQIYSDGCDIPPVIGEGKEFTEHGYKTGAQMIGCGKTKQWDKAEVMVYKIIKGKDASYEIQRNWRLPASDRPDFGMTKPMFDEGGAYLDIVFVCDPRDPQHACPQPKTSSQK